MRATVEPLDKPERQERPRPAESNRTWRCACGELYRVSGVDRHRLYWPVGAPPDAAVIDGCCVRCRRPLPGKQPHCLERS
jgi:hypothetical protein